MRHGANPRLQIHWLIDRNGYFREFIVQKERRGWTKPISWLVNFVLLECELKPGRLLTINELLSLIRKLKSPLEFQQAKQFQEFLEGQDANAAFDRLMFRAFWDKHFPRLKEYEWNESYPV